MRPSARRSDDSDVIRARLRALLAEVQQRDGWVPEDEDDDPPPAPWARPRLAAAGPPANEPDDAWDADWDDDGGGHRAHEVDASAGTLSAGLGRHRAPGPTARLDPGRPGAWALWLAAVLAAVVVVGWTWLGRPEVDQVPTAASTSAPPTDTGTAPPSPEASGSGAAPAEGAGGTVVVSVVGLVAAPGLVTLPAGSRVADALAAAGGLLPEADPAAVNAAAVLTDGQQIAVGVAGAAAPGAADAGPGAAGGGVLDLNAATVGDLDALPGIGPVLAQRIVDHRTAQGPFTSVDQLDDVSGIGPAIFADLVDRVRV